MIPRYARIAYWSLVAGIVILCALLLRGCERNQERLAAMRDASPIAAPADTEEEQVSIARASDADGSISLETVSLALPAEPALRARALLDRLFADAAQPTSGHPLPPGPAVSGVFLLPLPLGVPTAGNPDGADRRATGAGGQQLAVVNLTKAFADAHPSGVESEDLTLRAVIATLGANLSQITQVRFLVDGEERDTLAGHASLRGTYPVVEPLRSIHPLLPGQGF